jgi:hypothetical protein
MLVGVTSMQYEEISDLNVTYVRTLLSIIETIVPKSLNYKRVEILCCSQFKDIFPAVDVSLDHELHLMSCIFDLGMEQFFKSTDWIKVLEECVRHTSLMIDNENFAEHSKCVLSKDWKTLVHEEMTHNQDLYAPHFLSENDMCLYQEECDKNTSLSGKLAGCTLLIFANILKSSIIILSDTHFPIQTVHPTAQLLNKHVIVFAVSPSTSTFLSVRPKNKETTTIEEQEIVATTSSSCTCGKGRSSSDKSCSSNGRCPCANSEKSCSNCKCVNCSNAFGTRFTKAGVKTKSCRCGKSTKNNETREVCLTSRCECYKFGYSCTMPPVCNYRGCCNEHGKLDKDKTEQKRLTSERDQMGYCRKKARMSTLAMMDQNGVKSVQSIWSAKETILIFYCDTEIRRQNNHGNTKMVHGMYQNIKTRVDRTIRDKSLAQVTYKLLFFKKYSNIYRNGMNPK